MWEQGRIQMHSRTFSAAQVNGQKAECEAEAAKIEGALVLYDGAIPSLGR